MNHNSLHVCGRTKFVNENQVIENIFEETQILCNMDTLYLIALGIIMSCVMCFYL